MYELDELQAQMEKSQHSANRTLTEAEDYRMDAERQREKCDKLQVSDLKCLFRPQLFTSLLADLRQDIRKCSIKAPLKNAKPPFMS